MPFQYKIIHNILATKVSLFRDKICDNNVCPQCLTGIRSLDLMFLRCSSALAFWKTFQSWWAEKPEPIPHIIKYMQYEPIGIFDDVENTDIL